MGKSLYTIDDLRETEDVEAVAFGLTFTIDFATSKGLGRFDANIATSWIPSLRRCEYAFSVLYVCLVDHWWGGRYSLSVVSESSLDGYEDVDIDNLPPTLS